MIGRKKDPKLGPLMIELRDCSAKLASREAQLNNALKENEALSAALDNRPWLARIEELELELADYKGVHGYRNERMAEFEERALRAEQRMREMKESIEEILRDMVEQLGR